MKLVIDSNGLRSQRLRSFLSARRSNRAVLIDYASVEAYKKNPLVTVQRSMEILGEYPTQVLVLHATGVIATQDSRKPQYVRRMIWNRYTRTFPLHTASLPYIGKGDAQMIKGAIFLHSKAREFTDQIAPEQLRNFHVATAALFERSQFSELRQGHRSPKTLFQMLEMAGHMAAQQIGDDTVFGNHSLTEVLNHFAVRRVLAQIIQTQSWRLDGSPDLNDARLRNDYIDTAFATYGTYFNGLMTADRRASKLHNDLREYLSEFGEAVRIILPRNRGE